MRRARLTSELREAQALALATDEVRAARHAIVLAPSMPPTGRARQTLATGDKLLLQDAAMAGQVAAPQEFAAQFLH